jgi:hypothetical protein
MYWKRISNSWRSRRILPPLVMCIISTWKNYQRWSSVSSIQSNNLHCISSVSPPFNRTICPYILCFFRCIDWLSSYFRIVDSSVRGGDLPFMHFLFVSVASTGFSDCTPASTPLQICKMHQPGTCQKKEKKHKCIADSSKSYQFRSIPEGFALGILGYHTLQSKIFRWREPSLG